MGIEFPNPLEADNEGLVFISSELKPEWVLDAYRQGIFPWYSEGQPVLWWSPNPRCVLYPKKLKVSKSMRQLLNQKRFSVTYNNCFAEVMEACATIEREGQDGTWITPEMKEVYGQLHEQGYARSVEVWDGNELVGGLYGVLIGKVFFGESMFAYSSNASKYGFIEWVGELQGMGIKLIDCQVTTRHLLSLGAEEMPRKEFIDLLQRWC